MVFRVQSGSEIAPLERQTENRLFTGFRLELNASLVEAHDFF
jgi:hypothetical protein